MNDRSADKPIQLLDFKGYSYYLVPGQGKIVEKSLPIKDGYEVLATDYVRIDFSGRHMVPTIPPHSILRGKAIPMEEIPALTEGVYAALLADKSTGNIIQVLFGRLKAQPVKGSITLWPDADGFKKITIQIAKIAFLFRIREYIPREVNEE